MTYTPMGGFAKLFSNIIYSSIWGEDDKTRILWITMLAMSDKDGNVRAVPSRLRAAANMELSDCLKALEKLTAPDPESRTKDHEGRRIVEIPGGWHILNYTKYRDSHILSDRTPNTASKKKNEIANDSSLSTNDITNSQNPSVSVSVSTSVSEEGEDCKEEETKFDTFWNAYPRKVCKAYTVKCFKKAIPKASLEFMLAAIESQKKSNAWTKDNGQFIPYPSTWLNGERWNDVLDAGGPQKFVGQELIIHNDELKRLINEQTRIEHSYSENQNWSREHRDEYKLISDRIIEVKKKLGVII